MQTPFFTLSSPRLLWYFSLSMALMRSSIPLLWRRDQCHWTCSGIFLYWRGNLFYFAAWDWSQSQMGIPLGLHSWFNATHKNPVVQVRSYYTPHVLRWGTMASNWVELFICNEAQKWWIISDTVNAIVSFNICQLWVDQGRVSISFSIIHCWWCIVWLYCKVKCKHQNIN